MSQINWITDFNAGLALARQQDKLAFVDFFNPT
jgi:hypothetical protein